jgi:hypothetical protein
VAGEALPAVDLAMRHNPALGIMPELVERRAVPIDRLEKGVGGRHLYEVL